MASVSISNVTANGGPPTYTSVTYTATLDAPITGFGATNIAGWVTFNGSKVSDMGTFSPGSLDGTVWNGTIPNVNGVAGNQVWVVAFVTPPNNNQPFSNSSQFTLPTFREPPTKQQPAQP